MPWKSSSARRHTKKARTPKLRRRWMHVANSMLKRGKSEGSAVRAANAVVKRGSKRKQPRRATRQ